MGDLSRDSFFRRFRDPETAAAAWESYQIAGEGRLVRQPPRKPALRELWARRWARALALHRGGLTYESIARVFGLRRGDRAKELVALGLREEQRGNRNGAARAATEPNRRTK